MAADLWRGSRNGDRVRTNFLLIDLENVQPDKLHLVNGGQFKVKVFVGASQSKISVDLARAVQPLGSDAEYIQIDGSGRNALDFHIAYYIGRLAVEHPNAFFHILSKDTGFDPLIKHLKSQKILCQRSSSIEGIPLVRLANSKSIPDRVDAIIENLTRRKAARPRTRKTLASTIKALFQAQLTDDDLAEILNELKERGVIELTGEKVSYALPA